MAAVPVHAEKGNGTEGMSASTTGQTPEEIEDLGVISETAGEDWRSKFRANASVRTDYTTNAQLSGNHGSGDLLVFPTVEFGFNTGLGKGFSFDIAARVESGLYARNDERAFVGYGAVATFDWRPRPNLPRVYVSAEPYRYDGLDTGDLMTQAIGAAVGTDWGFSFNAGRSLAFFGYSFTNYFSDPTIDNRSAHKAVAGIAHQFLPQLTGQLFYAYQFSDYQDIDRDDSRHVVGLTLTYQFSQQLFGSLSGSFIDSESTQDRASYQNALLSAGLTLQF
jgi:hypothetical protein